METTRTYGRETFGKGGLNDRFDVERLISEIGLNASEIEWRKEFIGFDREDERRLERYEDAFAANAERIADEFYDNLTTHEQTREIMSRSEKRVEQLKETQSAYLTTLAAGDYDAEYFRDRARIGKIHDVLEMPMKHYLGQYGVYYDLILPLVGERLTESLTDRLTEALSVPSGTLDAADASGTSADIASGSDATTESDLETTIGSEVDDAIADILSILRIINLDMQVVTDTYIHSYNRRLETAVERNEALMADVEESVRRPISDLQQSADDVSDSADTIGDAAAEQSDRLGSMASEIENLSAAVEEIASTADRVAHTSDHAETLADDGKEAAADVATVMEDVDAAVDGVLNDVASLQERVGAIEEFVDAIDDIANQTNLLALNASIEAARAGEDGAGFGVVADEIKSLAEESQQHANDIESLVADIRADTEETVASLSETEERVERGAERVADATERFRDIDTAVSESANGIREVSTVTDEQATAAERITATADEIANRSTHVTTEIQQLAAANEKQAAMIEEVWRSVRRLSGDAVDRADDSDVTTPDDPPNREDLPDDIPEPVIETLSHEQIRSVTERN